MTYEELKKLNSFELDDIASKGMLGEEVSNMARQILYERGYYR